MEWKAVTGNITKIYCPNIGIDVSAVTLSSQQKAYFVRKIINTHCPPQYSVLPTSAQWVLYARTQRHPHQILLDKEELNSVFLWISNSLNILYPFGYIAGKERNIFLRGKLKI